MINRYVTAILSVEIFKSSGGNIDRVHAIDPILAPLVWHPKVQWMCHPRHLRPALGAGEKAGKTLAFWRVLYDQDAYKASLLRRCNKRLAELPPDHLPGILRVDDKLRLAAYKIFKKRTNDPNDANETDDIVYTKYVNIIKARAAVRNVLAHPVVVRFLRRLSRRQYQVIAKYASLWKPENEKKGGKGKGKKEEIVKGKKGAKGNKKK